MTEFVPFPIRAHSERMKEEGPYLGVVVLGIFEEGATRLLHKMAKIWSYAAPSHRTVQHWQRSWR